jgi:hypothetical protein
MKRPIDIKRDGAGSFTLGGQPGEVISEMIVVDDRMIIVSNRAIYEA